MYIADGHTFDAEVMHPKGGQPCRPEITSVLDVATRRWLGWSVALAESTWAVADALRHAVETGEVSAIYYADAGPGQKNAVLDQMLARLGTARERSIARNSQARGTSEVFHKHLIKLAKRLPSFMGADMDGDAKRIVHLRSRRELRTTGASPLLLPWERLVEMLTDTQAFYNARAHRSPNQAMAGRDRWRLAAAHARTGDARRPVPALRAAGDQARRGLAPWQA